MAMVGGGVDMGRSYLAQARLQQACDAGVLAARKRLGSEALVTGAIPDDAGTIGQRFFNINFRRDAYGSTGREFAMTLEDDYAISGVARATIPTTIMRIFGFEQMPLEVSCMAQINFANTDVMMVLDVTGSMSETNPGDTSSRMDTMKATIRNFHSQLAAASGAESRIRYGFVPYSTNVNVGGLLKDEWVVPKWTYQSRDLKTEEGPVTTRTYNRNWTAVSGTRGAASVETTYPATYLEAKPGYSYLDAFENLIVVPDRAATYSCDRPNPANSFSSNDIITGSTTQPYIGLPPGTRKIEYHRLTENGTRYWTDRSGDTCYVKKQVYDGFVQTYERVTDPQLNLISRWNYRPIEYDVADWRTRGNGCIEERDTYEIGDYASVDLAKAIDLDIDRVPTAGEPATQWRPMRPDLVYARAMRWNNTGAFQAEPIVTNDEYVKPQSLGTAACPAAARKLSTMTRTQLDSFLDSLQPTGSTYHDIGMIWGGRLISPTGLFASENADVAGKTTGRHLIFLTDGETAPLDLSYSSYGMEPIDRRRWSKSSVLSLTQTVENRFAFACKEVRKRNVTVWVIGFGTELNETMKECAGPGRYFEAADATHLNASFAAIAKSIARLRIER